MPRRIGIHQFSDSSDSGYGLVGIHGGQCPSYQRGKFHGGLRSPDYDVIGRLRRLQIGHENIGASLRNVPVPGVGANSDDLAPARRSQSEKQPMAERRV